MKAIAYKRSILNRYTENIKYDYDLLERRHDINHDCYSEAKANKSYDLEFWQEAFYHTGSLLRECL